jgi:predicted MFS family arabinose efflux permease
MVGWAFVAWQRRRERIGDDPLVHLDLFSVPAMRSGLAGLFSQNLTLMGVFFVVPLYLQLVLGLDALETGLKMLPVSVLMFASSVVGARLSSRFTVRSIVRAGLVITAAAALLLLATVEPELDESSFAWAMGLLGLGMGLMASQLGNVVQSSVESSGRAEAGGLQYTGQQLGSSLGVALIGAIVLSGLTSAFVNTVQADERVSASVAAEVERRASTGVDFITLDDAREVVAAAGVDDATSEAVVEDYGSAQIAALKSGFLAAALFALLSLPFTRSLPHARVPSRTDAASPAGAPA